MALSRSANKSGQSAWVEVEEEDDCDDDCSWDSIISVARDSQWYEKDNSASNPLTEEEESFLKEFDVLERELKSRMARLEKLMQGKNLRFQEQLRRRELAAASRRRQDFIRNYAKDLVTLSPAAFNVQQRVRDMQDSLQLDRTGWQGIVDFVVFEWNTTVPAIVGLFLHSVAMGGFYFIVQAFLHKAVFFGARKLRLTFLLTQPLYAHALLFLIGAMLTRCSGYLYWWLRDDVHDCLKFDYHNRLRLNFPGARILHSARSNLVRRLLVYMIGYNICFQMADNMYVLFSQRYLESPVTALRNLPSKVIPYDPYWNDPTFVCDRPCDAERQARQTHHDNILEDDFTFTQNYVSATTHGDHWAYWINAFDAFSYDLGEVTEQSWTRGLLVSISITALCVALLRWYGFVFWKTVTV